MATGDVYELSAYHRSANLQNMVNVTHYRVEGVTGSGLGLQEIADALSQQWSTLINPFLPTSTTYQGARFRRVFPNPTNVIQTEVGAAAGAISADPLPDNCCLLVSRRSYTAPVFVRGRTFLPAPSEGENDTNGRPSSGYRTSVATAFTTFCTFNMTLGTLPDTVEVRNGIYRRNASPVFYPADYLLVRTNWTSQRRRRPITRPDLSIF